MEQITSGVFVETGNLGSNNSIILADEGTVLIDAPHKPTDAARWRDTAAEFGETSYLVHTDHHIDHTLGNFLLPGKVVSHSVTRRRMAEEYPSWGYVRDLLSVIDPKGLDVMPKLALRLPTVTFEDGMQLHLGDVTVELMHLPGHTGNSLVAYLPERGVLFSGDNVCEAGLPSFQDADVGAWFEALDRIAGLDFEFLVPGHGEVGTKETVETFRDHARDLVRRVGEAARAGIPADEAADRIGFEDKIHTATASYAGYPDDLIEQFQRRSVLSIYGQLTRDRPHPALARSL
ncbi:MBL fold metallo-hydrolase [Rubrobacter marinus]|uniref:MBL fold metallo-hydrolase n=1 Tax=Rubrobacter marinus TaxID=2653852 RepID=A0A6G8PWB7_9ACTN|nr:MBL fold metallo-hydrolase [Rubrobacter marinus]QIN78504.1 MBL fold metallo-hydrolase [Rubrobacter marinus]